MYLQLKHHKIYFQLAGSSPQTLVFTHGLGDHSGTWQKQVTGLARQFRVLTWDMRAHGKSGSPRGTWAMEDLTNDLFRLVADLGFSNMHLVGHSAGGAVSVDFTIRHPDLVRSLTLIGSASEADAAAARNYERLAEKSEKDKNYDVLKAVGLRNVRDAIRPDPSGFAKAARCMGSLYETPLTPLLKRLRCPVLILVGEHDFMGQGGSHILHRHIPSSRLVIVPGRGHALYREDPVSFNSEIVQFLGTADC